jgi:hypothetical protein
MIEAEKVERLEITGDKRCTITRFEERGLRRKTLSLHRTNSNQNILIPECKKLIWLSLLF